MKFSRTLTKIVQPQWQEVNAPLMFMGYFTNFRLIDYLNALVSSHFLVKSQFAAFFFLDLKRNENLVAYASGIWFSSYKFSSAIVNTWKDIYNFLWIKFWDSVGSVHNFGWVDQMFTQQCFLHFPVNHKHRKTWRKYVSTGITLSHQHSVRRLSYCIAKGSE